MPNGWTTSGIDWTNEDTMRESRTEDIVKNLHQAVSERDHWIQKSCYSFRRVGYTFPAINTDARFRLENSIDYIYSTLNLWFRPYLEYDFAPNYQDDEIFVLPANGSVFIDLDKTGVSYNTGVLYYGYKNIDYSVGGELENLMGFDVGFIRDYTTKVLPRINLSDLRRIYLILQQEFYHRAFDVSYNLASNGIGGWNYNGLKDYRFSSNAPQFPDGIFTYAVGSAKGSDSDSATARNAMYSASFSDVVYQTLPANSNFSISRNSGSDPYIYTQGFSGLSLSADGFDGNQKSISDIDCKSLNYGNRIEFDEWGSVLPVAEFPSGFYIKSGTYESYNHVLKPNLSGEYMRTSQDKITSGIPAVSGTNKLTQVSASQLVFVNFDKDGVLNYFSSP